MKQHYDIIIMGAGMVGTSLACALIDHAKTLNLRLALIEPNVQQLESSADHYQSSFDRRATALSYGSALIYQQMSVWDKLKHQVQPIEHIHVSDKGHFGAARLHAAQEKVPALGYVIENKWLGVVLQAHLREHENSQCLEFYSPATVERVERVEGVMKLELNRAGRASTLTANLVVMADGGRSEIREKLGISYSEESYYQHALVTNVEIDRRHENIAYERFTDTGPVALLPLLSQQKRNRCGLIWTFPDAQIEAGLACSDSAFLEQLQQKFGFRAGRFTQVGERYSYPLKLQRAQEQVRSGLVILGNAAHTLHPIAGQGFNLALRGVAALATDLKNAAKQQQDLGSYSLLHAYQKSRSADQQSTISFSDQSMRLFSNNHPLLAFGRNAGLQLLDICPAAKTVFSRGAMGLSHPVEPLN
jgi:2-octaprenyl-6-methoxyphenol hydroxylase